MIDTVAEKAYEEYARCMDLEKHWYYLDPREQEAWRDVVREVVREAAVARLEGE